MIIVTDRTLTMDHHEAIELAEKLLELARFVGRESLGEYRTTDKTVVGRDPSGHILQTMNITIYTANKEGKQPW